MKSIKKFIERMDSTDSASSEKKLDGHHRRSSSCNSNNYSKKNSRRLSPQSAPITPQPQFDDKSAVEILSILPEKKALKKTQSASPTIIKEAPSFQFPLHTQEEQGEEGENEFDGLERKNDSNEADDKIRHSTGGFNFFAKGNKSGRNRKISLPWFRTNSVTAAQHAGLSRQHTIDSPGHFTSYLEGKVGNLEVTWVVADHTAAPGTSQLTVSKGQQVEIIEYTSAGDTDFCLVRLNPQTDDGATQEGLVPISVLNPPPGSGTKAKKEKDVSVDQANRNKTDVLTPGKRSGSGFKTRKWIPQPLRKFSNNKPSTEKQPPKKLSDKTASIPIADLNISTDPAEDEVEIPPPMKPIHQDSQSTDKSNNIGNNTADLAEIEQIVRDKTKQHGSKFPTSIDLDSNNLASHSFDNEHIQEVDVEKLRQTRMRVLEELINTEQDYINDLGLLVNGYMIEINNEKSDVPLPDDLKDNNYRRVFANIEAIYEFHREHFITSLKRCQQQPSELGPMFKRYEKKLNMYSVYCRNKQLSDCYVQKHQSYFIQLKEKMNHRLELSDLLIKPVQRITKYELLLKEVIKHTEIADNAEEIQSLKEAYHIVKAIVKTINDMMELEKLENFDENISNQGKLVLHGILQCSEEPSDQLQKFRRLKVFLCEQSIIFSDIIPKKNPYSDDTFIYRAHFKMNKMRLEELSSGYFLLKSIDPKKSINSFTCRAENETDHQLWLETIRRILSIMNDFLLSIQNPLKYAESGLSRDSL